jgi:hypothetical protein
MPSLRSVSKSERLGARRWDALVLGSGIASLVTATRLGMAGHRVLVAEEERAVTGFPGLREPFFLAGSRDHGLLDTCLRELTLPLIERRRIENEHLSLQILGPELRLDVADPGITGQELVAWGVAKPEAAQAIVRTLVEAAEAERQAMIAAPVVRIGRRLARSRPGTQGSHVRGLPAEAARPSEDVGPLLAAQVRALSNLADTLPSPEARARLLGSLLSGGSGFGAEPPWLSGLLRHRAESVHVEFRSLEEPFEIVENEGEPGLMTESGQLWLGRTLVIGAPETALARVIDRACWPDFLDASRPARRRLALHLRCKTAGLPEGMGRRLVVLPDPDEDDGLGEMTISLYASDSPTNVEVLARAVMPGDPRTLGEGEISAFEDRLEARVRSVIPFADKKLTRREIDRPLWDDEDWLEDPPPGQGWPAEIDLRVNGRPPVYRLDRAGIAGLGLEGDLLLGWRAGDAIAAEF